MLHMSFSLTRTHTHTHTQIQQRTVYDRRTSGEKVKGAIAHIGHETLRRLGEEEEEEEEDDEEEEDTTDTSPAFGVGDIVALVEPESTMTMPRILLAKVLRMEPKTKEVLLAHLRPVPPNADDDDNDDDRPTFRLTVGRDTWTEDYAAVVYPIDVTYNRKSRTYRLNTSAEEIHSCIIKKNT